MLLHNTNRLTVLIDRIRTWQLVVVGILLTLSFAFIYFFISQSYPLHGLIQPDNIKELSIKDVKFQDALYFSIVTETTLGYGDIRPIGFSRWIACCQVFFGLFLAGMIVAKITSAHGREKRLAGYMAQGYWIELIEMPDKTFILSFAHIYLWEQNLRYDGNNFDENGKPKGFWEGELTGIKGHVLTFEYSNRKSLTDHFDEGICNIAFSQGANSKVWTQYQETGNDFGKKEYVTFEGFRASDEEIAIFHGKDLKAKQDLVQKYAKSYKTVKPYFNPADNKSFPLIGIFEDTEYAKIESKSNGNIMIVSPDLSNVLGRFKEVVKENMERGIIYTYVIPESNEVKNKLLQLVDEFKPYPNKFQTFFLDIGDFKMLTANHIAILNVDGYNGEPTVYLQEPMDKKDEQKDVDYWVKLNDSASNDLVIRVRQMLYEKKLNK